eukprot:scaffold60751_cov36-Cyclotella_meneghiniana.AAC.4
MQKDKTLHTSKLTLQRPKPSAASCYNPNAQQLRKIGADGCLALAMIGLANSSFDLPCPTVRHLTPILSAGELYSRPIMAAGRAAYAVLSIGVIAQVLGGYGGYY